MHRSPPSGAAESGDLHAGTQKVSMSGSLPNRSDFCLPHGQAFFVRNPSKSLQIKCGTNEFRHFENEFHHFENEFHDFGNEF